jgi:hypothetical protein
MHEKRKGVRRSFERPAWIVTEKGAEPINCTFKDLSKSGARLSVVPPTALPQNFVLHMAANGSVARKCVVVWKSETGDEIGVAFVARLVAPGSRPIQELPI